MAPRPEVLRSSSQFDRPVRCFHLTDEITNDPIHGTIHLDPLCLKIIDTPQFQRLRNIKQLGGCYFIYPGASHNRFEHSIGVCHLAGKLARHLKNRMEEDITKMEKVNTGGYAEKLKKAEMKDDDVLCIEIAGLCHDLGHGPFSHLFEDFSKAMKKKNPTAETWKHEDISREMFDHMIKDNASLKTAMEERFKIENFQKNKDFILNLITGNVPETEENERKYMYEIVANKRNEIDVDKMDYFARDCHGLGMKSNFDQIRYINQCRVMFVDNNSTETTIAVREKEQFNLYELFHTRVGLFRRAYFHRVTKAVEIMLTDALVAANDHIQIPVPGGKPVKMSKAWESMPAYQKLTDYIFDHILWLEDPKLEEAKSLITRVYKRELYKLVYESAPHVQPKLEKNTVKTKKLENGSVKMMTEYIILNSVFTKDDFTILDTAFSYGKEDMNPIKDVYFYKKGDDIDCCCMESPEKLSLFLPSKIFQENVIRVYSKSKEDGTEKERSLKRLAEKSFDEYNKRLKQDIQ